MIGRPWILHSPVYDNPGSVTSSKLSEFLRSTLAEVSFIVMYLLLTNNFDISIIYSISGYSVITV